MEATAKREQQKSFDVMASINLLQYDLDVFGEVQKETRERIYDEELSFLSEAVDRAALTTFTLKREGDDLVYFNQGDWSPYTSTLLTGLNVSREEAEKDYRRAFLVDRATKDLQDGYKLRSLKPGQRHIWYSAYPKAESEIFGEKFISSCGFKPERQMAFLYLAQCNEDGSVTLESQTVDSSEDEAFQAVITAAAYDPDIDIETMTRTYDGSLMKKYGGYFFAGRTGANSNENAWEMIQQHRDLINYHLDELDNFANSSLPKHELEQAVKEHLYGVWAAFKIRIDNDLGSHVTDIDHLPINTIYYDAMPDFNIREEIHRSFEVFASRGEALSGCGGRIEMDREKLINASPDEIFDSTFGKSISEKYGFDKKMFCVVCQAPPKKGSGKKECGPCGLCRDCDKKASIKS